MYSFNIRNKYTLIQDLPQILNIKTCESPIHQFGYKSHKLQFQLVTFLYTNAPQQEELAGGKM